MLLRATQGFGVSLADVMAETGRLLVGDERNRPPIPAPIQFNGAEPEIAYYVTQL